MAFSSLAREVRAPPLGGLAGGRRRSPFRVSKGLMLAWRAGSKRPGSSSLMPGSDMKLRSSSFLSSLLRLARLTDSVGREEGCGCCQPAGGGGEDRREEVLPQDGNIMCVLKSSGV